MRKLRRSFRSHLVLVLLIAEMPILIGAIAIDQSVVREGVYAGFALVEQQTQDDLVASLNVLDDSMKVLGESYRPSLEIAFQVFVDEYLLASKNPQRRYGGISFHIVKSALEKYGAASVGKIGSQDTRCWVRSS
ncbi:MAG: hypothetical protein HXY34_00665 [Candidatus Thorarchaeota archaeon]|nr:hypothetical protein [Candidatus Thorarchaeota archaeon]